METIASLRSENNPGSNPKGKRNQKMVVALTESAIRRKRFSDITNTMVVNEGEANPNGGYCSSSLKEYMAMLFKENNALLRLLDERNKIIEITGTELQKLKISLQKGNQQNWQLAQANSHMLAELNLGKDRLKAMQHELGCKTALLRAKTLEVEELKKLNKRSSKQLGERIIVEECRIKPNELVVEPASLADDVKKTCNTNRKRTLRSRSLGPSSGRQESAKEKDEGRRRSLRRPDNAKTGQWEPSEDLFEIEDINLPINSHEDGVIENQNPGSLRRLSLGRPMRRRAAEKVSSYKELPVNVKMRRAA